MVRGRDSENVTQGQGSENVTQGQGGQGLIGVLLGGNQSVTVQNTPGVNSSI